MDLLEVETSHGLVVSFDGRVLELFGSATHDPDPRLHGGGLRFTRLHVKQLVVTVSDPDKKGIRELWFKQTITETGYTITEIGLSCDEPTLEQFRPMLDALRAAGVSVSP